MTILVEKQGYVPLSRGRVLYVHFQVSYIV